MKKLFSLTAIGPALALAVAMPAEAKLKLPKVKIKIGGDVGNVLKKAGREVGNLAENVGEAAVVVAKLPERTVKAVVATGKKADQLARSGKPLEALGKVAFSPLSVTEKVALQSARESSVVRVVGQVAASVYGGPGGGAAYSAWYTGRTTGDLGKGFRAGAIGFAASSIGGQIGSAPASGAADVAAKAVASGTVSGVASEALGGEFEDGFVAGAATSLAHDYYAHYTGKKPDPRPADKGAIAKVGDEAAKVPGSQVVDSAEAMRKLDPRINHIGKFTATPGQSGWAYEGSSFMRGVNKIFPGTNAMAYFHDTWAIDANLGAVMNPVTIVPATVLTYTAIGANQDAQRLKTSTEGDDHE